MRFKDLTPSDVGKWYLWPEQRPVPIPFEYLGILPSPGEPSWLIQQRGLLPNSMLMEVWGDTEIEPYG
jgi:hypothetical protein